MSGPKIQAMSFASALSCIDGRIQRPVNDYLRSHFGAEYIDTVTRAGIIKHLTASYDSATSAIVNDLEASIRAHGSTQIALVAHHECAGNPEDDDTQMAQLSEAVEHFRRRYPDSDVIGLWLGEGWAITQVD